MILIFQKTQTIKVNQIAFIFILLKVYTENQIIIYILVFIKMNGNVPSVLSKAMGMEKKPFTYLPGGIDFSELKSPKMQKRINKQQIFFVNSHEHRDRSFVVIPQNQIPNASPKALKILDINNLIIQKLNLAVINQRYWK